MTMCRLQGSCSPTTDHIAHTAFENIVTTRASMMFTLHLVGLLYDSI